MSALHLITKHKQASKRINLFLEFIRLILNFMRKIYFPWMFLKKTHKNDWLYKMLKPSTHLLTTFALINYWVNIPVK